MKKIVNRKEVNVIRFPIPCEEVDRLNRLLALPMQEYEREGITKATTFAEWQIDAGDGYKIELYVGLSAIPGVIRCGAIVWLNDEWRAIAYGKTVDGEWIFNDFDDGNKVFILNVIKGCPHWRNWVCERDPEDRIAGYCTGTPADMESCMFWADTGEKKPEEKEPKEKKQDRQTLQNEVEAMVKDHIQQRNPDGVNCFGDAPRTALSAEPTFHKLNNRVNLKLYFFWNEEKLNGMEPGNGWEGWWSKAEVVAVGSGETVAACDTYGTNVKDFADAAVEAILMAWGKGFFDEA